MINATFNFSIKSLPHAFSKKKNSINQNMARFLLFKNREGKFLNIEILIFASLNLISWDLSGFSSFVLILQCFSSLKNVPGCPETRSQHF